MTAFLFTARGHEKSASLDQGEIKISYYAEKKKESNIKWGNKRGRLGKKKAKGKIAGRKRFKREKLDKKHRKLCDEDYSGRAKYPRYHKRARHEGKRS